MTPAPSKIGFQDVIGALLVGLMAVFDLTGNSMGLSSEKIWLRRSQAGSSQAGEGGSFEGLTA